MSADAHMTGKPDLEAEWWTTTDVANHLGVRVATISAYRAREQMPAPDFKVGRTWLWNPDRIKEWRPTEDGNGDDNGPA